MAYDAMTGEAMAVLRRPLRPGASYRVRVTQGIEDLAGIPLAHDYVWGFRTAGGVRTFLPFIGRGP